MCGCDCSVPRGSGPQSRFLLLAISVERVFRGMHCNQTTLTCQTDPVPRLRTSSGQSAQHTPNTLSPNKFKIKHPIHENHRLRLTWRCHTAQKGCEGVDQKAERAWAHGEHAK